MLRSLLVSLNIPPPAANRNRPYSQEIISRSHQVCDWKVRSYIPDLSGSLYWWRSIYAWQKNFCTASLVEKYVGKKVIKHTVLSTNKWYVEKFYIFDYVMSTVVSVANFIRSRGLTHRLFWAFLEEKIPPTTATCSITLKFVGWAVEDCRLVVVMGRDCRLSTAALDLLYYPRLTAMWASE
jgi:hypothetical protein